MKILINNIREYRKKAVLTQEELANHVGVTRQTIIAIENGNYSPSVLIALTLASILNTTVEKLFHLTNKEVSK